MVPVISQATEANPEDMNMDIEGTVEEDTGLTQQLRTVNPSPLREVTGTDQQGADAWPWSDDDEVSNPEYPEQQDELGNNPEDSSQTASSPVDIPEVHLRPTRRPHHLEQVAQGLKRPPGARINQGGPRVIYAPKSDVFLRKPCHGRPPGVKLKNTGRVRLEEPIADPSGGS